MSRSDAKPAGLTVPLERLDLICRRWKIAEVLATDETGDDLNLVIAFTPDATPTLFDVMDVEDELSEAFGRKAHVVSRAGIEANSGQNRANSLRKARVLFAG